MIVAVRFPRLLIDIECRDQPSIADKAFAIGGSLSDNGIIQAVSQNAADQGINVGMKRHQAKAVCPDVQFLIPNPARYHHAITTLESTLAQFSTHVEAMPNGRRLPNHWFVDIHDLKFSAAVELTTQLAKQLQHAVNLRPTVGVAAGKFTSQVAAVAIQPSQLLFIHPGQEGTFLSPFPIGLLPLTPDMARRLPQFGIRSVGQFAALPRTAVQRQFGKAAAWPHQLACGDDPRRVKTYVVGQTEQLAHQLDEPVSNRLILEAILGEMGDELTKRVQSRHQVATTLLLRLRLEDQTTVEQLVTLRQSSADAAYLRRMIGQLLDQCHIPSGVIELTLEFGGFIQPSPQQPTLFEDRLHAAQDLKEVLQQLVKRYGNTCFYQVELATPHNRILERQYRLNEVDGT